MSQTNRFAAQLLESSAPAYAGYAASLLVERNPTIDERYAPSTMKHWKLFLTQRILELAAALSVEEPRLFASRLEWQDRAFQARTRGNDDLLAGLVSLRDVLDEELPPPARGPVADYLSPALAALSESMHAAPPELDPNDDHGRLALQYLQAVLEGDVRGALDLVSRAQDAGTPVEVLYLDVLLAAQRQVGDLWHLGELGVAEEHVVTTTTQRAMAIVAQRAPRASEVGKTVLTAAVAGDHHGLGVRTIADFFEMAGWRAICLGPDVPAEDVATGVVYFEADLVALSATLATHLKALGQTVDAIRAVPECETRVLVGGGALAEAPDVWRRLGADGYTSSAAAAVSEGGRLVGLTPIVD